MKTMNLVSVSFSGCLALPPLLSLLVVTPVSDSQPPTSLSLLFHFCLHVFKSLIFFFKKKFFFLSSHYQHVPCSSSASLLSHHPFSSVFRSPSRSLSFCVISCSSCSIVSLSEVVLTSTIQLHIH